MKPTCEAFCVRHGGFRRAGGQFARTATARLCSSTATPAGAPADSACNEDARTRPEHGCPVRAENPSETMSGARTIAATAAAGRRTAAWCAARAFPVIALTVLTAISLMFTSISHRKARRSIARLRLLMPAYVPLSSRIRWASAVRGLDRQQWLSARFVRRRDAVGVEAGGAIRREWGGLKLPSTAPTTHSGGVAP